MTHYGLSLQFIFMVASAIIGGAISYGILKAKVDNMVAKNQEFSNSMIRMQDEITGIHESISALNGTLNQVVGKLDTWICINTQRKQGG